MIYTFYTLAVLGCLLQLLCIIGRGVRYESMLISLLIILMILETVLLIPRALGLLIPSKPLSHITFDFITSIYYFYAGCFVGFLILKAFKQRNPETLMIASPRFTMLLTWLKIAAALFFLYSSLSACYGFAASLQFFQLSGYSESFMIAIIILEFFAALGLLYRKTSKYAAIILIADMCGAVVTHFINYYHHRYNNPLTSSIPALSILAVLLTILIDAQCSLKRSSI